MNIYLLVDNATDIIQSASATQPQTVPSGQYVAMVDDSASNAQDCVTTPTNYTFSSGSIDRIPYFTVAYDGKSLTAKLNSPGTTPATQATFVVGSSTVNAPIVKGTDASGNTTYAATLAATVHPSLANTSAELVVTANGCKSLSVNLGGTQPAAVQLQIYQTATAGQYEIAPVGLGSKTFLEAYYALSAGSIESLLADIATAVNLLTDTVFNVLVPAAQAAAYAPLALNADQINALNDIKTNVLPKVYTTLANAYPSGGTEQIQYKDFAADLATTFKNFESYAQDLAEIPGLA